MGSLIAAAGGAQDLMDGQNLLAIQSYKTELVVLPYVLITVVFVGMIVLVNFSDIPREVDSIKEIDTNVKDDNRKYVLHTEMWCFGFFAVFFYVGAEVSIASKLYAFLKAHIEDENLIGSISYIIPYYWGGAMVCLFVGAEILKESKTSKVLFGATLVAVIFLVMAIVTPTQGAMFMILGVGLFNSVMWPALLN